MNPRGGGARYWLLVALLVVLGGLGFWGVGRSFLVLAIALLVLAPKRREAPVFWPAITGVAAFLLVYTLVAPASCTSVKVPDGKPPLTACRSVTGIPYGGDSLGDLLPALMFASTAALPAAWAARNVVRRRGVTGPG